MTALRVLAAAALAFVAGCAAASEPASAFRVEVSADKAVKSLLEEHLDIARYAQDPAFPADQLARAVDGVAEDARALLATEGYFSPQVETSIDRTQTPAVIRVRVVEGPRTHVRRVRIEIAGAIRRPPAGDPDRADAITRGWRLGQGEPFRQETWDAAKGNLLRELLIDRFPYARLVETRAEVDPVAAGADLLVRVDSGPLVRFGAVEVHGVERYAEEIVRNLKPFRDDDPYRQESVLEYQARLQTSGYFDSAVVTIDPPGDDPAIINQDAVTVPVTVTVAEHPLQAIKLGVGFSTNTGYRFSVEHAHNDILGRDWRLLSSLRLEAKSQSAQVELVTPFDERAYSYRTLAKVGLSDIQGLRTRGGSIGFGRVQDRRRVETGIFGQLLFERRSAEGGETNETTVATLNYSWTYRNLDSVLQPTRGYVVNLQGGGGVPVGSSGEQFLRGYTKAAALIPVGPHTLHLRGEVGRVWASSRTGIPEEFLFRAGGDSSVRGYAFQELGVKEGDAVVGGRYLATGTVEYVHRVLPDWGVAVFVDAGNAADSLDDLSPVYGYGLGARWRSPVGAIGIDVAYGEAVNRIRVHFSLGFTF